MNLSILEYYKEAFNARPAGMFVAPNWVALVACGFLGLLNPGAWLIGAAAELLYLNLLAQNKRFQKWVEAKELGKAREEDEDRIHRLLVQLPPAEQTRYQNLASKAQTILQTLANRGGAADLQIQAQGLGRLTWIYLQLLLMRDSLRNSLRQSLDSAQGAGAQAAGQDGVSRLGAAPATPSSRRSFLQSSLLEERIENLTKRLDSSEVDDDLRKSLSAQVEILRQRLKTIQEAQEKLAFVDAELVRIQEQIELIRDQTLLSADPGALTQRIDSASSGLENAIGWIREQQKVYGAIEDLTIDAPSALPPPMRNTERQ